jgi:hypothetical protein
MKGDDKVVLVNNFRRNFSGDDFLKKSFAHDESAAIGTQKLLHHQTASFTGGLTTYRASEELDNLVS